MSDEGAAAGRIAARLSVEQRIWRRLHEMRERFFPAPPLGEAWLPIASGQAAGDLIYQRLVQPTPTMIARLGAGELDAMLRQLAISAPGPRWPHSIGYMMGKTPPPWWDAGFIDQMELHPGFFPVTPETLARFVDRMLTDLPLVDILGSWLPGE